jgi:flavin reductase (DIM6/NTAB) family NADH-FMN oxidoreductase RutF
LCRAAYPQSASVAEANADQRYVAPILIDVPGAVECRVVSIVEQGDHHIVVGEVIDAHLSKPPTGRPDSTILEMKDLGESVFYGG